MVMPAKLARNAPPIIVAFTFAGAAFDTKASITGQYHMNAMPMPKKPASGHSTDSLPSLPGNRQPTASRSADAPVMAAPMAILVMLDGSLRLLACHAHSATSGGAATMLA